MQNLSAFDAISPAFARTRAMLLQPFRAGRSWKLAAAAYIARSGTVCVPFPIVYLLFLPAAERAGGTPAVLLLVAGLVLLTAAITVFFYLATRMQFVVMELVLERGEVIAPAWRRYGPQARSWMLFKMLLGSVVTLVAAVPLVRYGRHLLPTLAAMKPGEPPPPGFLLALFATYAIFILVFGSFYLVSSVMQDVVLPPMIFAGATAREGLRDGWTVVRREPGEFVLFLLVKTGLTFFGYLMLVVAFEVVLVVVLLVIVGIGLLLHLAGVSSTVLLVLGITAGVVVYLGGLFYGLLMGAGAVSLFLEAHAVYFLGGRFERMGAVLDRTEPGSGGGSGLNAALPGAVPPPPRPVL